MKILIIRFSSFGDVVLTTPVIKKIKEQYPDSEIDFIVYKSFSEGVTDNPNLNKIFMFERKKSKDKKYVEEIIKKLKEEKYDYVLDLHSKILSRVIGKGVIRNNKGVYLRYNKRKWWKTLLVKLKMIDYNADNTIVESYFSVFNKSKLSIKYDFLNSEKGLGDNLEFYINDEVEKNILEKYKLKEEKYFVLAPGASKFTKKWPYYNELSKELLKNTKDKIFVIGGKEDKSIIDEDFEKRIINLCGEITFKESGVILKYANIVIANDSGPFHISRALKKETFVFFGPTDPKLFSFEKNTHLIYNEKCRPHSLYGDDKFPKKYEECMSGISVSRVVREIMDVYNEKKGEK